MASYWNFQLDFSGIHFNVIIYILLLYVYVTSCRFLLAIGVLSKLRSVLNVQKELHQAGATNLGTFHLNQECIEVAITCYFF